jgi:hypothetical protein
MSLIRVNERLAFGERRLINLETALISTAFDLIALNPVSANPQISSWRGSGHWFWLNKI